ncbi:hypothetical protein HJFPF1_08493 [Paramyrothecium foliicola]|nr:hypothetical protein HJFPF1_08493 [Paramyrothecium foliicola]
MANRTFTRAYIDNETVAFPKSLLISAFTDRVNTICVVSEMVIVARACNQLYAISAPVDIL